MFTENGIYQRGKKSKESDCRLDCIHPALLYFMYIMGRIFLLLFLRLPLMKYGKAIGFFKLTPSVQFIPSVMSDSLRPHGLQHARPPCPSPTPGVYLNLRPLSWWYHPTISFSVVPSPPTFNLSHHQGLFKWVSSSHQVAKVLELQLQHQSFQWIFRTEFL